MTFDNSFGNRIHDISINVENAMKKSIITKYSDSLISLVHAMLVPDPPLRISLRKIAKLGYSENALIQPKNTFSTNQANQLLSQNQAYSNAISNIHQTNETNNFIIIQFQQENEQIQLSFNQIKAMNI
jgi:hypothetical protein